MFRTFIRSWPDGIEPYPGRRTYKKTYKTKHEAQNACARWNATHKAGEHSKRMDYEQIKTTTMNVKDVLGQVTGPTVINADGQYVPSGFLVPVMDPITLSDTIKSDAINDLFRVLEKNGSNNVCLYIERLPEAFKFQFVENFTTSFMATDAALKRNTQIMKNHRDAVWRSTAE